jgi:DMATS type aromatic prenyltransferase
MMYETDAPLVSFGEEKLRSLCRATGFAREESSIAHLFAVLTSGWVTHRRAMAPTWKSDVSDDHTPFEFSLAFAADHPELRMLVEPQGVPETTPEKSWQAGLAVNERLRAEYGVSLERFHTVRDLFAPQSKEMRFSLWHAACCRIGEQPDFKLYLNPQSQGREPSRDVVKEALKRLQLRHGWSFLERVLQAHPGNSLLFFSLDLFERAAARVKVYVAHHGCMAADVDEALALCGEDIYRRGTATSLCRTWGGHQGPFTARPLLTCYAFLSGNDCRPHSATFYFPIRSYVAHDGLALRAIQKTLRLNDRAVHQAAIRAFTGRCLEAGVGLQSWVSVRKQGDDLRTTIYLATEAYGVEPARKLPMGAHTEAMISDC